MSTYTLKPAHIVRETELAHVNKAQNTANQMHPATYRGCRTLSAHTGRGAAQEVYPLV